VASPPRGDASTTLVLGVLSIVGAFLLLIGSFLPWATVQAFFAELSVNGFDAGDGKLTAAAGFVSLILFVLGTTLRKWPLFLAGAIVCGLGGLVAGYDVINLSNEFGDADLGGLAQASIGIGLWLCLLGALLGTATAIAALVRTASKP
jgi:hypothetical protein